MRFLSLDDISFRQPVNIGSIVRLASLVSHTSSNDVYPAIIVCLTPSLRAYS